jgi:hypothetical protein
MDGASREPPSGLSDWLAGYAGMRAPRTTAPWRALAVVAIGFGLATVLWSLPVPAGIGRPGLYAALAAVALLGRYLRLSRALAAVMLGVVVVVFAVIGALHASLGADALMPLGVTMLVGGLVGAGGLAYAYRQPIAPAIVEDAWLGPAWLLERASTRLGFRL